MDIAAPHDAKGPCVGVRVLNFSTVVSGPLCTQILGDLGADVVKVETPGGEVIRQAPPLRAGLSGVLHAVQSQQTQYCDRPQDGGWSAGGPPSGAGG
jgi:crotonobetainyl-CoA:carnitine CoA-transferase CaiB-like acyl-CoA transferase